jgi:hypothetical protein
VARRFETLYRIKSNDDLGSLDWHDRRWDDIDRRTDALETKLESVDEVAQRVEGVALDRINNVVTPLVVEAIERVRTIPAMFSATSTTSVAVGLGPKAFVIAEVERNTFAALAYVTAIPTATPATVSLLARVVDYDVETGLLSLDVEVANGAGTYADWIIRPGMPRDLGHETRTDNPHAVTAAQVGAYTTGQVDTLLAPKAPLASPALTGTPTAPTAVLGTSTTQLANTAFVQTAIAALINGAPGALDTLNELAAALGADANFAATVTAALAARLRTDADQGLTGTQYRQASKNLHDWETLFDTPLTSAAAVIDVPIPAGYRFLQFGLALRPNPAAASQSLLVRYSTNNGAGYLSGGTDYAYGLWYADLSSAPNAGGLSGQWANYHSMPIGSTVSTAHPFTQPFFSGEIALGEAAAFVTSMRAEVAHFNGTGYYWLRTFGATSTALYPTNIRFAAGSGGLLFGIGTHLVLKAHR